MDGKWSGNSFLLGSNSLVNHGGAQSFFLLPTTSRLLVVGSKNSLYLPMYELSTYLVVIYFFTYLPIYKRPPFKIGY
jgi:hypothetical protein